GNPSLKPERSEELEVGFDLGLLGDRVELLYTRYQRTVKDAMVNAPLPPSKGFSGSQVVNLGLVKGWGDELQMNLRLLTGRRVGWDMSVGFGTTHNRIDNLGPGVTVIGSGFAQNVLGYSI